MYLKKSISLRTTSYEATMRLCFFTWCCNLERRGSRIQLTLHEPGRSRQFGWGQEEQSLPHALRGWPGVMQRVQILFAAELAHLVHPMAGQRGRTYDKGGQGAAVRSLAFGILLSSVAGARKQSTNNSPDLFFVDSPNGPGAGIQEAIARSTWGSGRLPWCIWTAVFSPIPCHHTGCRATCTCSGTKASWLHPTETSCNYESCSIQC